jgi:hypothetical protein
MNTTTNKLAFNLQANAAAFIAFLMFGLLFCTSAKADDIGMKLAKDRSIVGKNQIGQCAAYADALFAKMNAAGVEAYRVSFDWSNLNSVAGQSGAHAVVVFRSAQGRYYGVDNMTWKPIWLKGNNSQQWATFIAGMDTSASVRDTVASRAASLDSGSAYARN